MPDDAPTAFHSGSGPAFAERWVKIVPSKPPSQSENPLPAPPGDSYFAPLTKY